MGLLSAILAARYTARRGRALVRGPKAYARNRGRATRRRVSRAAVRKWVR